MMYVVSGCPRSGTSMMMRIMDSVFGRARMLGSPELRSERFPQRDKTEIEKYIAGKAKASRDRATLAQERAQMMNPNGYYEMQFCVRGVHYSPQNVSILRDLEDAYSPRICKIVSQGLALSDRKYINKVVYMARDPRAVAKSQENLGRGDPMTPEMAPEVDGKKVLIRSVDMFNAVTVAAARWIVANPSVPVHVVNYDELLDDPAKVLAEVQAFIGEGDFSQAHTMIDTTLRRSAPEDIPGEDAAFAMGLFGMLKASDFAGIVAAQDARLADLRENPPPPTEWYCTRLKQKISVEVCKLCHKPGNATAKNLMKNAEKRRTGWRNEPCAYECGIDGTPGISVAESIAKNHWRAFTE